MWPFGPLCERSRRPLDAPLTRRTRCSIAQYSTKTKMPEVGSLGVRDPEKEEHVDNAPRRGYQPQPVAPLSAPPMSRAGGEHQRRRPRRHFELDLTRQIEYKQAVQKFQVVTRCPPKVPLLRASVPCEGLQEVLRLLNAKTDRTGSRLWDCVRDWNPILSQKSSHFINDRQPIAGEFLFP